MIPVQELSLSVVCHKLVECVHDFVFTTTNLLRSFENLRPIGRLTQAMMSSDNQVGNGFCCTFSWDPLIGDCMNMSVGKFATRM